MGFDRAPPDVDDPQMLSAVLDAADDALIVTDRRGIIRLFNQAAERVFGRSRQHTVGRSVDRLMGPLDAQQHEIRMAEWEPGRSAPVVGHARELTARRGDGRLFPALLRVTPLFEGGAGFIGLIRDLTPTKQADPPGRRRHVTAPQARDLASVGAMAMGIAHDVNNMLAPIVMNLQLLEDAPGLTDEDRRLIEDSILAAQRAQQVVERVLALGTARAQLRGPYVVARGVREAMSQRGAAAEVMHLTVGPGAASTQAEVNAAALHQALLNLIVNAEWAVRGRQGARIDLGIEVDLVPAAAATDRTGRWIRIEVRDNGVGIPAADLSRVRDPQYSTRPPHEGTGLGLSIVASIVREAGGFFEIMSEEGVGTRATLWLPRLAEDGVPLRPSEKAARPRPRRR